MKTPSEMTKEELGTYLAPLTELACKMILHGTLKKNVMRHFTNRGLSFAAAENLMEVGVFKAEKLMKYKAK